MEQRHQVQCIFSALMQVKINRDHFLSNQPPFKKGLKISKSHVRKVEENWAYLVRAKAKGWFSFGYTYQDSEVVFQSPKAFGEWNV